MSLARNDLQPKAANVSANLPRESEVVVVGGGAIGLMTALTLREAGVSVTVLERRAFLSEASGVNAGTLAIQNKLSTLVPYTLAALREWKALAARLGVDVGYQQPGGYNVATTEDEVASLERNASTQAALGVDVRWLDRKQLATEAPWLGDAVRAATFSPQDSFASPLGLATALVHKLRSMGVNLIDGAEVQSLRESADVEVGTNIGTIRANKVLICCGAWSASVAALMGVDLLIKLDVNMLSVTDPCAPLIPNVVCHARGVLTMKQTASGTCLIGGGWQGVGTLEDGRKDIDYESILYNVRLAARVVPGLAKAHIVRQWSGHEGVTPDSLPYLGRLPGSARVYVAACARGGFTMSPVLGQLAAEQLLGKPPSFPTELFRPDRLTHV